MVCWVKFTAVMMFLSAISLIGSLATNAQSPLIWFFWLNRIALLNTSIVSFEILLRGLGALFMKKTYPMDGSPLESVIVKFEMSILTNGAGLKAPIGQVDLAATSWFGPFLSIVAPWVVIGIAVILWLSTSVTQIGISETGVRERFGRSTGVVLEPGLHLSFPWPIDRVIAYCSNLFKP